MIHVLRSRATKEQLADMLAELEVYVKVAVDVERSVLAGGAALHADCEAALIADGSRQTDVWGADWIPHTQETRFEALMNIRPGQGNPAMTLLDARLRERVEAIVRRYLGGV